MATLELWKHPENYMGDTFYDYYVGPGRHRDSDIVANSNFDAALEMLGGEREPNVIVEHASHWAVGWVDVILVHKNAKKKVAILQEIMDKIEDYPVLDEDDWSQKEMEAYDEHYKDWGRDEAAKILGLEDVKLTKKQEQDLWRAWNDAQQGSADDPSTSEDSLVREAKRLGLI